MSTKMSKLNIFRITESVKHMTRVIIQEANRPIYIVFENYHFSKNERRLFRMIVSRVFSAEENNKNFPPRFWHDLDISV